MNYRCVKTLQEIKEYLGGAGLVAFDFETSPDDPYRGEERAALDAHKAHIVGVSFSVAEGSAVYAPLAHRAGENAVDQDAIWRWLTETLFQNSAVIKVAHNLSFESMFLYALGIILQGKKLRLDIKARRVALQSSIPRAFLLWWKNPCRVL